MWMSLGEITKGTEFPMRLVSMIMLSALLTACGQRDASPAESDAEIQKKLAGTWVKEETNKFGDQFRTVTVIAPDGSYVAEGTFVVSNKTNRFSQAGTILFSDGVLTDTATKHSNTNARLPMVERTRIVRLDDRELVLQSVERPEVSVTFRKVSPESPRAVTSLPQIIDANKNAVAESKPPQSSAALQKAKKIKLSSLKFDHLPLTVVITMLQEESVKCDPAGKGVAISLGPDAKQLANAEINLELKDVTLAETLGRVADSVGLEMQATDTELLLVPKKTK